jgi:excisionase family DNA binding protein
MPIARIRRTSPQVVQLIDELLETMSDQEVAVRLNELNHRNWLGEAFTMKKVTHVRIVCGLKSRSQRMRERGLLTAEEVARQLGISTTTVHHLVRTGLLTRHPYGTRRCLYEPPGNVKLIKGVPSRAGSRPPRLIAVQPSE